jgi:predicted dehydrogenase
MGSALGAPVVFSQNAANRVGTGVIGTGNRGSYVMQGVLEQPNAKVVALCDIKPDRLDKAATTAAKDNPKTYTDYRKLLDDKNVEAVVIATPPHLHVEMAIAALKAGKHVYCEKPIGITAQSIQDLVKAAKSSNKVFQVGQQMRSYKQMGQAIERIRQGAIGDVIMIKAQRHSGQDLDHNGPSADWFFDVNKSGGYLIEMSVHNLDACNWAVGAHPVRAAGFGGIMLYKNDPPGRSIMDGYSLTYDYPNGAKLSYTQLVFHPKGLPNGGQYIYVYGTKGAVDLMGDMMFYPREGKGEPVLLAPKQQEERHAHVTAFYECIQNGKKSPAGIDVGATGALTAIMGHQAIENGKVVTWRDLGVQL